MKIARVVVISLGLLAAASLAAGQAGLFSGAPPTDLGARDGRLKAPSTTDNSVSSQAALWPGHPQAAKAAIEPLPAGADGAATLLRLREIIVAMPRARVVESRADYLRVEFTTRWMGFIDDAEFWFDPASGTVQVRSASRLGEQDLGVNRQRIEALRASLSAR